MDSSTPVEPGAGGARPGAHITPQDERYGGLFLEPPHPPADPAVDTGQSGAVSEGGSSSP